MLLVCFKNASSINPICLKYCMRQECIKVAKRMHQVCMKVQIKFKYASRMHQESFNMR